jgi:hypothetical protein
MPSLKYDTLQMLRDDYKKYSCFIETGTLDGGTIFALEPYFDNLYTVEYSEKYYNKTRSKYNGNKINFILGDSSNVFETLLPNIHDNTIFFLDGHWSSGDTGRSEKDCPLIEEVTHIYNLCKSSTIIIIDDCRMFGTCVNEDWSEITENSIMNVLKPRVEKSYYLNSECSQNDRWIIHLSDVYNK